MNVETQIVTILNLPLRSGNYFSNLQEFPPALRSLGIHDEITKLLATYKQSTQKIMKRGRMITYLGILLAIALFVFGQSKFINAINHGDYFDYSWILGVAAFSLSFFLALAGCFCASVGMKSSELKLRQRLIKEFNEKCKKMFETLKTLFDFMVLDKEVGIFIEYQLKAPANPEASAIPSFDVKLNLVKFEQLCQRNGLPGIQSQFVFTTNQAYFTSFQHYLDLPPSYAEVVSEK